MAMDLLVKGERVKALVLNRPMVQALTLSGYLGDGSDFAGWIPLRGAQLASPLGFTTALAGLALAGALLSVNWLQTQADPTFGTSAAINGTVTYNPVGGLGNHMAAIAGNISVDGNAAAGNQMAGYFKSQSLATRTGDVLHLQAVYANAIHKGTGTATLVHAVQALAQANGGTVTTLIGVGPDMSVNNATAGEVRGVCIGYPSYTGTGTSAKARGLFIDDYSLIDPAIGGVAHAVYVVGGVSQFGGPVTVTPTQNGSAGALALSGPLLTVKCTNTQADPPVGGVAPLSVPSAGLGIDITFAPAAGVQNIYNATYSRITADGVANLGTLAGIQARAETPAGATRTGTMIRLAGVVAAVTKRDTSAGVITFADSLEATVSIIGGSVTNVTSINVVGQNIGGAGTTVTTLRGIWLGKPIVNAASAVTTSVGVEIDDYSTIGAQGGAAYAIRVAGGLSYLADLRVKGSIGFYDTVPVAKQAVAGSRGGNVALQSLLTALATTGLLTDNSVA